MLNRRLLLAGWPLLLPASPAAAHALVTESAPVAGATLADAPARAVLRFNSRIDQARSKLTLIGPDGTQRVLPLDTAAAPTSLEAALPGPIPPGAWRLRWQVLAVDGHITRGDIAFTIAPR